MSSKSTFEVLEIWEVLQNKETGLFVLREIPHGKKGNFYKPMPVKGTKNLHQLIAKLGDGTYKYWLQYYL